MIKKESASKLRKVGQFYTNVPSETVKSIKDAVALGIWIYLQSQSDEFVVRAAHLQDHFDLSRERYRLAMRYLRDFNLIRDITLQDERGRISDRVIECHALPFESIDKITVSTENRTDGKTRHTDKSIERDYRPLINNQEELIKDQYLHTSSENSEHQNPKESEGGRICAELRKLDIARTNPQDIKLLTLLKMGLTAEDIIATAEHVKAMGKPEKMNFFYVLTTAENRRRDAEKITPLPSATVASKGKSAYDAYLEAVAQQQIRQSGGDDRWSDPAIFHASVLVGGDLQRHPWADIKVRWYEALDTAKRGVSSGKLSREIPAFDKNDGKPAIQDENVVVEIKPERMRRSAEDIEAMKKLIGVASIKNIG